MREDFEKRVLETGLRLFDFIEGESPSVFQKQFWTGKVLEWCMGDESFKVEMFRFIDVFPYLTRPESIAKHLQEYFARPEVNFPPALQWGIKFLSPHSMAARMIVKPIASNIMNMAKQFIVGADPRSALPELERLRKQGMAFTVDLLGEAVVSEREADEYLERYLHLLDILGAAQTHWSPLGGGSAHMDWGVSPKVNVSIKVSSLYSQMNPCAFEHSVGAAKERLRPLLRKAISHGAFVTLDMESRSIKNLTLALYRELKEESEFRDYPHTGIVIQSYLRDSEGDLANVLEWSRTGGHRLTIRLVKGAYWDAEVISAHQNGWPVPVFTNKHATDANFEKLARMILARHDHVNLACASHNMRSIAAVMESAKEVGMPPERVEYQVLYGMGEPVRNALKKTGLPLRVYAPVGEMIPGMSYLVRRLLENTANESFLRQGFVQGLSRLELLRSPEERLKEHPEDQDPYAPKSGLSADSRDPLRTPFCNEPRWDWTSEKNRARFRQALEDVRKTFPVKVPLVIGGRKIHTEREIRSSNPNAPGEQVGTVACAGLKEAEMAMEAAKAAFPQWRDTDPVQRAQALLKAAAIARSMRWELAALQVFEVGKNWSEADADVIEAIDFLEYYAREMVRLSTPRRMGHAPGEVSHLFYEPRGVCFVIAPWNFPFAISVGMTSAALVAGNSVIYKPASQSPVIGSMVYEIFGDAGLPPGVLNFLPGSGAEIGDHLVSHPDVAIIAFTGSREVGLHILELAARTDRRSWCVKQVIAEMGGKNAVIVDADADLDEAVQHILQSAFGYQGQKCSACSRLIVLEENYEKLLARLKAGAESLNLGPVEDPANFMGAVIEPAAQRRILEAIEMGKKEGDVLVERQGPAECGHFAPLTILTGIRPEHRIAQEEVFGPVLAVMKVRDFDEALEAANSTSYALTGGLFSRSPGNIARARKEFRVGNLYINRGCTGAIVGRHPFGGFKMSGVGSKAGGPDYLLQFMVPRNVVENTLRRGFAPLESERT
ncbi:MAG: bifunctional proline dehydrogenase/L-glutamate gamma-semialdehyde dehydrogenase [Deltaproteobacteria bacterium]|nr:bifunctional proline dehydrogenase/L-glutamate gamma-semialdehyde dehydrogenase [Deltaproteobacteria bacterium]